MIFRASLLATAAIALVLLFGDPTVRTLAAVHHGSRSWHRSPSNIVNIELAVG